VSRQKYRIAVRETGNGQRWVPTRELMQLMVGDQVPETEQYRRYFGRGITPETIEGCIVAATHGHMRDLTDLTYETLYMDPHFSSVTGKRIRALASITPEVIPATGPEVDPEKAEQAASLVRHNLAQIPRFTQAVIRLGWSSCHGRAALENQWQEHARPHQNGGLRISIREQSWIHPRRLSLGPERELRVRDDLWQGYGFEEVGVALRDHPNKFVWSMPQLFNDYPEREGFGPRGCYFAHFKRFGWRERMILLEVFGKPWRIVFVQPDATISSDALADAADQIEEMGANASGRLPKGLDVKTDQPQRGAGEIHRDVVAECDDQISKLVLGQTRTTDAKPAAIGSAGDQVAQDSESLIIAADAWQLSEDLTEGIARPIVALNLGPDWLPYAPRIDLPYELPPDRATETANTKTILELGVPLKAQEVYERTGWTKPEDDDEVIQLQPQGPAGGAPGAPGAGGMPPGGEDDGALDAEGEDEEDLDPLAIAQQLAELELRRSTRRVRLLRARKPPSSGR